MESEERAPIKWMAPETIENDVYTEATDVVSEQLISNGSCTFVSHIHSDDSRKH